MTQQVAIVNQLDLIANDEGIEHPHIGTRLDVVEFRLRDYEAQFSGVEFGMLVVSTLRDLAKWKPKLNSAQREKVQSLRLRWIACIKDPKVAAKNAPSHPNLAVKQAGLLQPCGCRSRSAVLCYEPETPLDKIGLLMQTEDLELDDDPDIEDDENLGVALQECGFTCVTNGCDNDTIKCAMALYAPATADNAEGGFVWKGRNKWFRVLGIPDVIPVAVTPVQVMNELGTRPFWALH